MAFNASSITLSSDEANAFASFITSLVGTTNGVDDSGKVCLFGNDEITQALAKNVSDLKNISELSKTNNCKVLYIAKDKEKGIRAEIIKIKKKNLMTIAIFDEFIESGGMILVQMGRRNFELTLNPEIMKNSGLRLSPLAINLVIN